MGLYLQKIFVGVVEEEGKRDNSYVLSVESILRDAGAFAGDVLLLLVFSLTFNTTCIGLGLN
jgi:hypothetical protein